MKLVPGMASASPPRVGEDAKGETFGYRTYGSFEEAGCLKEAWNDLARRVGDIHCSFDWCEVWWKYFGTGRRLEVHTLHDGPRLVAVLPLFRETIRPAGVWLRTVRVLGCDYTTGTIGLAVEPAYAEPFTRMLLQTLGQVAAWDILEIAGLRCYATVIETITEACARNDDVQTVIVGRQDAWQTIFHLPDTYDKFLASLSSNARSDTRRRERRLAKCHAVEVSVATTPPEVAAGMEALIRLHQKRWTDKGRPGQLRDSPVQQFHLELAQRLAPTGQLVLLTLTVDGQVLAATYGYRFGHRTHGLIRGQCNDPQWQEYSLGRLLHCQLIRHAIEQGSCELEDGRGVFDYKLRLGGKLYAEPSLVVVRKGRGTRLRFWAALRTAYVIHVFYSRIWLDMIAPVLGIQPKGSHFHLRNWMLAQLFRKMRMRLFGGPRVVEMCRVPMPAAEHQTQESHAQ